MKGIVKLKKFFMENNIRRFTSQLMIIFLIAILAIFIFAVRKTITVVVDGKQRKFVTFQSTVGNALKKEHINVNSKDKVSKDLNAKIVDNDVITIRRAVNLKVVVDGKELDIKSAEENVGSMLDKENIILNPEDKILPDKNIILSNGMNITITRVQTKVTTESVAVAFDTIVKNDNDMLKSQSKVLQEGQNGEKQVTTNVVYENGKEISRKVIKETITKSPVNKIISQGTLSMLSLSRGGTSISNGRSIRVKATAYCANGGGSYTSSGRKAVRNPNGYSTIAVDPRVIPLGTNVYVEGYGYAIAADQGSAVSGNYIDVFFDSYSEASNWGLKYVNVYILQ